MNPYKIPTHRTPEMIDGAKAECVRIYQTTGSKIDAIKYVRNLLMIGLKEAKDFFEDQLDPNLVVQRESVSRMQQAAPQMLEALRKLVTDLDGLIADSTGVYGLHLNGDASPWGELLAGGRFEEWLASLEDARAVVAAATTKGE